MGGIEFPIIIRLKDFVFENIINELVEKGFLGLRRAPVGLNRMERR